MKITASDISKVISEADERPEISTDTINNVLNKAIYKLTGIKASVSVTQAGSKYKIKEIDATKNIKVGGLFKKLTIEAVQFERLSDGDGVHCSLHWRWEYTSRGSNGAELAQISIFKDGRIYVYDANNNEVKI